MTFGFTMFRNALGVLDPTHISSCTTTRKGFEKGTRGGRDRAEKISENFRIEFESSGTPQNRAFLLEQ
uniref:Uncharacterized protein n=1 Tax=Vespula pensylvanica TaxID=30213 RepID=A0A834NR79_VESPE|nr:hypothetical protein H0235_012558 [Vespula pensylvanica]